LDGVTPLEAMELFVREQGQLPVRPAGFVGLSSNK
jgi:hypothetical protein